MPYSQEQLQSQQQWTYLPIDTLHVVVMDRPAPSLLMPAVLLASAASRDSRPLACCRQPPRGHKQLFSPVCQTQVHDLRQICCCGCSKQVQARNQCAVTTGAQPTSRPPAACKHDRNVCVPIKLIVAVIAPAAGWRLLWLDHRQHRVPV